MLIAQLFEEAEDHVNWKEIGELVETAVDTPSKSFCFDGPMKEFIAKIKVLYFFGRSVRPLPLLPLLPFVDLPACTTLTWPPNGGHRVSDNRGTKW